MVWAVSPVVTPLPNSSGMWVWRSPNYARINLPLYGELGLVNIFSCLPLFNLQQYLYSSLFKILIFFYCQWRDCVKLNWMILIQGIMALLWYGYLCISSWFLYSHPAHLFCSRANRNNLYKTQKRSHGLFNIILPYFYHFSYKVTPETGYVAEVRYEGTPVFDALVAAPSSQRLTEVRPDARAPKSLSPQQSSGRRAPQPSGRQNQRIDENVAEPQAKQSVPAFFTA